MAETIYIIDPVPEELRRIADALASEPVVVKSCVDAVEFLDQVTTTTSGCVLVPLDLPGMGVRALMDEIKAPASSARGSGARTRFRVCDCSRVGALRRLRLSRTTLFGSASAIGRAPGDRRLIGDICH
jgi:hypothetical protein